MPTAQEIRAQLTGPGGPFEIVEETVEGTPMLVYKERFNDLRVVAAFGTAEEVARICTAPTNGPVDAEEAP